MDRLPDAAPRTARKPRLLILLGAALIATVATAAYFKPWQTAAVAVAETNAIDVPADTARTLAEAAAQRPVYKYSVLPGGVGSREELAGKAANDKVAAAHYASFEIDKAHVTVVARPRAVHVSYRKGDRIYWTKRKVMLAAGETLLSDGRSSIRTRCGNRISDRPQLPVEAGGPDEGELDTVVPTSAPTPEEGTPVIPGSFAYAGTTPTTATPPALTRTAYPMSFPGGTGIPGGGPIYGSPVPGDPTPGGSPPGGTPPGGTDPEPTPPGDTTVNPPPGEPGKPEQPLLPPVTPPVPEPRPTPETPRPPVEVPEPGTLWLGAVGAAAMLLRRRR